MKYSAICVHDGEGVDDDSDAGGQIIRLDLNLLRPCCVAEQAVVEFCVPVVSDSHLIVLFVMTRAALPRRLCATGCQFIELTYEWFSRALRQKPWVVGEISHGHLVRSTCATWCWIMPIPQRLRQLLFNTTSNICVIILRLGMKGAKVLSNIFCTSSVVASWH